MSSTLNPFGARPIKNQPAQVRPRCYVNGILSGYATALYQYAPLALTSASTNGVTTNSLVLATAGAGNDWLGVLDGIEYTDSNGVRKYSKYWPASLTPLAGSSWNVYVWDDPLTIFEIQCNGVLGTQTTAGQPYYGFWGQQLSFASTIGNAAAGSNTNVAQISGASADVATLVSSTTQNQLRIVDKGREVDNEWFDAYPIIQVMNARHQYIANKLPV